ncbi:putative protein kinase RLK-Pelle-LysM family [Medicago truncatula]|uniref:Protein kinase domain-containing protein n=1 Tax=Medicago truncatula TaxID=3880 RepID=A0A396HVN2_MEDTR|nr:putative protein kinase RLK-Pelle-LysM family [Medicago truncatula]
MYIIRPNTLLHIYSTHPNSYSVCYTMKPIIKFRLSLLFLLLVSQSITSESKCNKTCDLALASYYIRPGTTLANISKVMQSNVVSKAEDISIYNIYTILSVDSVQVYTRLNVPFPCDCINDEFLGHTFLYKLRHGDSYASIATTTFGNLVTEEWIERVNVYPRTYVPDSVMINVTVNCSCGNGEVSKDYGLFITYPLRPDDTLESIAKYTKVKGELLQRYNPGVNFSQGRGLVYIPGKDENGVYVPLPSRKAGHLARSLVAAGICIRGVCMVLLLAICIYVRYFRKKNGEEESKLPPEDSMSDDTLAKIATKADLDEGLLQNFNQDANFSKGSGIVFIPGRDENGVYVPLPSRKAGHLARSLVAAGICIRGVCMVLLLAICIYVRYFRKKNGEESKLPPEDSMSPSTKDGDKDSYSDTRSKYILVDKSPKFSYKVLANATENFSLAKKIGQGGFGEVYYGVLGGKKVAIKKMKTQATREFLSELKVLTSVRHLNLVHLIGYCVEGFLFLVYEYMENGNLSQHLHNSEKELMTLSRRMKIALDVARGLEYIHDHSVPVYIHRDIKSDNILLNKNFNGKIADFGLTKLTNIANSTDNTNHMAGTFGYMPPENAYGRISRKMDVYAFGVVLYELISAKAAVIMIDKNEFESHEIKTNESTDEYKSLVALFDEVMDQKGDPIEGLRKLVDPRLGDNYSIDSISKMAKLAKACINRDPKQRPKMRDVVVSLMKLISTIDDESRTDSAELSLDVEHDSN